MNAVTFRAAIAQKIGMDPQKLIALCQAKGLEVKLGSHLSGPVLPKKRRPTPASQKWKDRNQVVLLRDAGRTWPDIQLITKIPRETARYIYEQAVLRRGTVEVISGQ